MFYQTVFISAVTLTASMSGYFYDTNSAITTSTLDICVNLHQQYFGDTNVHFRNYANACQNRNLGHDCSCFNQHKVRGKMTNECYYYDLSVNPSNCGQLMSYFPPLLRYSGGLCLTIAMIQISMLVYIIFMSYNARYLSRRYSHGFCLFPDDIADSGTVLPTASIYRVAQVSPHSIRQESFDSVPVADAAAVVDEECSATPSTSSCGGSTTRDELSHSYSSCGSGSTAVLPVAELSATRFRVPVAQAMPYLPADTADALSLTDVVSL